MKEINLLIEDGSQEGRKNYIETNRHIVELVIAEALEIFPNEEAISKVFRGQEQAIKKIIEMFLSPHFSLDSVMYKGIKLFSQLPFWINYKTRGKFNTSPNNNIKPNSMKYKETPSESNTLHYNELTQTLIKLSPCVAADVIGYWLKANKKLLNELALNQTLTHLSVFSGIETYVSKPQETRYKADAAFRFLFLYLGVGKRQGIADCYEKKYLTRGENKPQYVSLARESHHDKHLVRVTIKKIIDEFSEIHKQSENLDIITFSLLKVIAKKSILDVYEFNSNNSDEKVIEEYIHKLKSFNKYPCSVKKVAL